MRYAHCCHRPFSTATIYDSLKAHVSRTPPAEAVLASWDASSFADSSTLSTWSGKDDDPVRATLQAAVAIAQVVAVIVRSPRSEPGRLEEEDDLNYTWYMPVPLMLTELRPSTSSAGSSTADYVILPDKNSLALWMRTMDARTPADLRRWQSHWPHSSPAGAGTRYPPGGTCLDALCAPASSALILSHSCILLIFLPRYRMASVQDLIVRLRGCLQRQLESQLVARAMDPRHAERTPGCAQAAAPGPPKRQLHAQQDSAVHDGGCAQRISRRRQSQPAVQGTQQEPGTPQRLAEEQGDRDTILLASPETSRPFRLGSTCTVEVLSERTVQVTFPTRKPLRSG